MGMILDNSSISGASTLHGAHQEAKKLTAKKLFLYLSIFKV